MNCFGLSLKLVVQMANNSNMDICIKCKTKTAHIFHDSGDYCLECWQHSTHPDIRWYTIKVDK